MVRTIFFLLASVILCNCTSETKPVANNDSSTVVDTLSLQPLLTGFEPDANWVTPTETVSQYGASGIVRDVVIDRDGIIWLAAWDGIISYDGKEFTNHTLKEGLSHHRVYSVMEDSKGNMWFGTMGAGAYKYDGSKFSNLSMNNGMINNVVFDLFEDMQGNIWFATTKGVSMYDGTSFTNYDSTDIPQEVYTISQDQYETMWFGGEAGLFQVSPSKAYSNVTEVLPEYGTHYSNVRDLYWSNGTMWIGAANGLYECRVDNQSELIVRDAFMTFTGYIRGDLYGDLLITSDGIYRFECDIETREEATYDPLTRIVADKNSLGIFGAREAKDGTIWYGAMDGLHSVHDGKDVSYKKP